MSWAAIPAQNLTIGATFQFNVNTYASDPNNPTLPLTYSLVSGAFPSGATIDPTTGLLTWATAGQQTGPYSFTVQVADDSSPAVDGLPDLHGRCQPGRASDREYDPHRVGHGR